jgi:prolyl-tRNA editing enzyme YbaK/EbsC (Cys-tRNA(Pro) deacylase)
VERLAAVVGEPAIRRATAREARDLTGFTIGGIPPVGHVHPVRVVMDPALGRHREVWAAAGIDRAVFPVTPAALRALTNAVVAPIAAEPDAIATDPARSASAPPSPAKPGPPFPAKPSR